LFEERLGDVGTPRETGLPRHGRESAGAEEPPIVKKLLAVRGGEYVALISEGYAEEDKGRQKRKDINGLPGVALTCLGGRTYEGVFSHNELQGGGRSDSLTKESSGNRLRYGGNSPRGSGEGLPFARLKSCESAFQRRIGNILMTGNAVGKPEQGVFHSGKSSGWYGRGNLNSEWGPYRAEKSVVRRIRKHRCRGEPFLGVGILPPEVNLLARQMGGGGVK